MVLHRGISNMSKEQGTPKVNRFQMWNHTAEKTK